MKTIARTASIAAAVAFFAAGVTLSAKSATLTGEVGDAMCGVHHMAGEEPADCTAECVKNGSDYALIVGNTAYTLKASSEQKAELAKLAGKKATIVGDQNGKVIQVSSVKAAM